VAGKVDDIPALAVFKRLAQAVAGDAVLQYAQINRETAVSHESAHELAQHLPFAAQVQRTSRWRQAEQRQDPQSLAHGRDAPSGVTGDLEYQADALQRQWLAAHMRDFERHDRQPLGLRWHYYADNDRRGADSDNFLANGFAKHNRTNPRSDFVEQAVLIGVALVSRREVAEVARQIEQGLVFRLSLIQLHLMVGEKCAIRVLNTQRQ
jgi:hypothetical protein